MPHTSSMYYSSPVSKLTDKLLKTFKPRTDGRKVKYYMRLLELKQLNYHYKLQRVVSGNIPILSLTNSYHGSYEVQQWPQVVYLPVNMIYPNVEDFIIYKLLFIKIKKY